MNNREYRDLYLEEIINKRTKSSHKTVLNIFLGIEEDHQCIKTKTLKNFTKKSILEFNKRDVKDFFNLLNKDSEHWSLSSKRTMFPKIKKFLIWIIDYYQEELIGDLRGIDKLTKRLELMELINFLNSSNKFNFEKNGHKTSDSNKSEILTIDELKDLFQAIMDYPNSYQKAKPIFDIMYRLLTETGCRITEFCSIVLDAKINSHTISIEDDLKERKIRVKWIKTEDKEQKHFRFYPISKDFQPILLNYIESRRIENKKDNSLPNFLFITKRKSKMSQTNMWYNIKRYCQKAGFGKPISPTKSESDESDPNEGKSISAHVFRHSLNNHRAKLGCPEDVRAILLNHGTGNINTDAYYKDSLEWPDIVKMFDDFYPYKELFNIK